MGAKTLFPALPCRLEVVASFGLGYPTQAKGGLEWGTRPSATASKLLAQIPSLREVVSPQSTVVRFGDFFVFEILLDVGALGDLFAEVLGPVFTGVLLHLLLFFVFGIVGGDESGGVGLVGRRLDALPEAGGGAGGVLGFVAADGVSEGVFGDGPGAEERVSVDGSGEKG